MEYKGYKGLPQVDEESKSLYGHVIGSSRSHHFSRRYCRGTDAIISRSVHEYLDFCKSLGRNPEKPFSGQFMLRIDPTLHRTLSVLAEAEGVSLNTLVQTILERNAESAVSRTSAAQQPELRRIHRLKPKVAAQAALPCAWIPGKSTKRTSKRASKSAPKPIGRSQQVNGRADRPCCPGSVSIDPTTLVRTK